MNTTSWSRFISDGISQVTPFPFGVVFWGHQIGFWGANHSLCKGKPTPQNIIKNFSTSILGTWKSSSWPFPAVFEGNETKSPSRPITLGDNPSKVWLELGKFHRDLSPMDPMGYPKNWCWNGKEFHPQIVRKHSGFKKCLGNLPRKFGNCKGKVGNVYYLTLPFEVPLKLIFKLNFSPRLENL